MEIAMIMTLVIKTGYTHFSSIYLCDSGFLNWWKTRDTMLARHPSNAAPPKSRDELAPDLFENCTGPFASFSRWACSYKRGSGPAAANGPDQRQPRDTFPPLSIYLSLLRSVSRFCQREYGSTRVL